MALVELDDFGAFELQRLYFADSELLLVVLVEGAIRAHVALRERVLLEE